MLRHDTCPCYNLAANGCWLGQSGFLFTDAAMAEIERMRTLLRHGRRIFPIPKTTKSTSGSVTWPATTLAASNQPCLKKRRVDRSPSRPVFDSITSALVPFWPLSSPPLASHTPVGSIPDFYPPSSTIASVVTSPSSTMEALPPFSIGGKLYVTMSTSNASILIPLPTALP